MTGFGRGEAADNGLNATVEIKTLNSRYLDVSIRLPQLLQHKELELKEIFQKSIKRGKLNVTAYINRVENAQPETKVDTEKVKVYAKLLNEVRNAAGIEEPLNLKSLTAFGDIFITQEEDDEETINLKWKLIEQATQLAIANLMEMRTQEGGQLKNDLISRINSIDEAVESILKITDGRAKEVRDKLLERIKQLIDDENIDQDRLEMEVVIMADKMDITEETVRLRAHLKFFLEAIELPEPAGRRLNFLTQEINRELNTIGSKANDSEIAHHVVRAKEMLEQIREQVQNVE